jgi:hypothetical protein
MLAPRHVRPHSSSYPYSLELDDFQFVESGGSLDATAIGNEFAIVEEEEPLIYRDPSSHTPPRRRGLDSTGQRLDPSVPRQRTISWRENPQYGSVGHLIAIMEKVKDSKVARIVDKLAVSSEPGLTNAQLMLTNYDLKPGLSPWNARPTNLS